MKQNIRIPDTDLTLSPMGLGTVDAGVKWKDEAADRIFDAFVDLGGNLIDSARVYNDWILGERGRSERVIGDWLSRSGKRNQVILATKGGHPDMTVPVPDMHENRLSKEEMEKDLDLSLKALRTDVIDLYFYHRDQEEIPVEELIETMEAFVKAGKIRYYGCSNWRTERMRQADAYARKKGYRGFAANQALFNAGSRSMKPMEDDTLAVVDEAMKTYHRENPGNILMPYTGNCGGFFQLLESKGEEAVKGSPYYTEENLKLAVRFQEMTKKYQASLTQVVLGFFTCQDFACLPMYAASKPERIRDAAGTFGISFEASDYIL